ncbi:alpha/beta fold hydrolase [Marinobacter panjinensis]|uniref:Alpha/beta fold hydrolase n=1 Tax=Marinobacter panjinensis TaxID=2576384 RepID=A0A4U6R2M1_9GAMM|nr:alpha/beta fold hydrolase [Marinobacter panjinensis]MCR8913605.1 alpha/beta fold hydrolase [Marinobacter panjinensis]TKV67739.1 alpha/beta fold hydrolase [Marinobacter panjinensis]
MNQVVHQIPLVVVGGWGVDAAMLLPLFDNWPGEIHLVSLTDTIMDRCETVADVARYLLDRYPCPSVWAGWSQGAQVAMAAASQGDLPVSRVITLAGFPRFVAAPDWPVGMAADTFETFRAAVADESGQAWRRFQQLLIHGCDDYRQARKDLLPWLKHGTPVSPDKLVRGLEWLEMEDQVALWRQIRVPALHLQAERDAVVRSWAGSLVPAERSEVVTVAGMSHWPRGQALTLCRDEIRRFVFGKGDLWQV